MLHGSITIPWAPTYQLGPLELSWHGTLIAAGIVVAAVFAGVLLRRRGLESDELWNFVPVVALAGIVGARVLFLIEDGSIADPGRWLGMHGFSIYGAVIAAVVATGVYMRRRGLDPVYVAAMAVAFPLGDAIGRLGCVVSGDHLGAATSLPWGVRYTDAAAMAPQTGVAYHSGGLYEIVVALMILPVAVMVWRRARRPLLAFWTVLALFGAGRFVIFFWRVDSSSGPLGLSEGQWISAGLVVAGILGAVLMQTRQLVRPHASRWTKTRSRPPRAASS